MLFSRHTKRRRIITWRKAMTSLKSMNRRGLLAAGTAASTMLAAPRIARSQSAARELRMTTDWPKNSPGLGANAQRLADTEAFG
jgi:hypothetical protein